MEYIETFLANYGYIAIFTLLMLGIVGPFIPDDTILVLSGFAAHAGKLDLVTTIAVAYAGSLCGISLSYALGRAGGLRLIENWPFAQRSVSRHLPTVERWFGKYGKWTLFFGYFVAGVRHFTALTAGMSRVNYRTFALYAYPGGLLWVISFILVGYFVGDRWEYLKHKFELGAQVGLIVLLLAGFVGWLWNRSRKARACCE
ncbi:MAG: alkaline phosphatase, DedA family [Bryobacterales bacterium]|nr:alkaline phosphatase, DedA family [Bryobacterales bacterium]